MSNTIQSKTLATTPLDSTDILAIVQGGVLKRTTVSVIAATNEESGTWTPTYVTDGTDFSSVTYDVQQGDYVSVGSLVWVAMLIRTDAITVGSASGNVFIGGLPFPVSGTLNVSSMAVSQADSFAASGHPSEATFENSSSTVRLRKRSSSDGASVLIAVSDLQTGAGSNLLIMSGWYKKS